MSYAIFTGFYGLPLSPESGERSDALHELIENEPEGVHTMYSGSADETPAAFGVRLKGFNECCHHVELSSIQTEASDKQKKEYHALYNALSNEEKEALSNLGEPRVFFLVHTS